MLDVAYAKNFLVISESRQGNTGCTISLFQKPGHLPFVVGEIKLYSELDWSLTPQHPQQMLSPLSVREAIPIFHTAGYKSEH